MQITHEEAHKLIQLHADGALHTQEKLTLSAHLTHCSECRTYAEEIKEVESVLVPVMKRQWHLQPIPLPIDALHPRRNSEILTRIGSATRKVAIGVVFLALLFSAWQLAWSGSQPFSQLPVSNLPVPTPSVHSTGTNVTLQNCAGIHYTVQENDTLESIAQQFSVSKEDIVVVNTMKTQTVHQGMELRIPVCGFTPTGTIDPTLFLTSYTPSISPVASTPAGG